MIDWSDRADDRAQEILNRYASDLHFEAARVAQRAEADTVSSAYVDQAATALRMLRPSSQVADVLLVLGPMLTGLAAGVGTAWITADDTFTLQSWLAVSTVASLVFGLVLTAVGATLKIIRR